VEPTAGLVLLSSIILLEEEDVLDANWVMKREREIKTRQDVV